MSNLVSQLESWYSARCNPGEDNHHGFQIQNIAEGGWWLRVDMPVAELERFRSVLQPKDLSPDDHSSRWIRYSITDGAFVGACAPKLLHELLSAFLSAAVDSGQKVP